MCLNCQVCQENQKANQKEPLNPSEIPSRPWSTIGVDLCSIEGSEYLVIADYYSKFPIVEKMPQPCTSEVVADTMKRTCSIFGIPNTIRSDNGPQFIGQAFQDFIEQWKINHITSSPRYPKSNGFVERQIQTVKAIIKKTISSNGDVHLALLRWRTTPLTSSLGSPSEIMFQRKIQDTLPSRLHADRNGDEVKQELHKRQLTQKEHYDRASRALSPLMPGQTVRVRNTTTKNGNGLKFSGNVKNLEATLSEGDMVIYDATEHS